MRFARVKLMQLDIEFGNPQLRSSPVKPTRLMFEGRHGRSCTSGECCCHQHLQHARAKFEIYVKFNFSIAFARGLESPALLKPVKHRIVAADVNLMRSMQDSGRYKPLAERPGGNRHVDQDRLIVAGADARLDDP